MPVKKEAKITRVKKNVRKIRQNLVQNKQGQRPEQYSLLNRMGFSLIIESHTIALNCLRPSPLNIGGYLSRWHSTQISNGKSKFSKST